MTDNTHTPGPWEARFSQRGGYWFIDYQVGGESCTLTRLECGEHDARLIAEAPAMLEALRKAQTLLRDLEAPAHLGEGAQLDDEIIAILARIEGEA